MTWRASSAWPYLEGANLTGGAVAARSLFSSQLNLSGVMPSYPNSIPRGGDAHVELAREAQLESRLTLMTTPGSTRLDTSKMLKLTSFHVHCVRLC